jgi:hypothetical protein
LTKGTVDDEKKANPNFLEFFNREISQIGLIIGQNNAIFLLNAVLNYLAKILFQKLDTKKI